MGDRHILHTGHATGARRHVPDPRDYGMRHIPGVAANLAAGPPAEVDLRAWAEPLIVNQGQIPCCVMASIALMKGVFDALDRGKGNQFEFLEAYHNVGGDDHQGVDARSALQFAQEKGLRIAGQTVRHRIGSYALAPRDSPENFVNTLKAALAAAHPCVLACRLPAQFGWDSYGPATDAYHQLCLCGGTADGKAIVGNSWGHEWGRAGFGRLGWDYLVANGFQGGDCYAWTATDCLDPDLAPQPAPSQRFTFPFRG